jgi:hypothetical protein
VRLQVSQIVIQVVMSVPFKVHQVQPDSVERHKKTIFR